MAEWLERAAVKLFGTLALLAVSSGLAAQTVVGRDSPPDPFAFFRSVVPITASDRQNIARGQSIVRILPGRDRQVAVFTAVPLQADGDRLIAWIRHIVQLKKNPVVLAIGRFSRTPDVADLAGLTLDEDDVRTIRGCSETDCGIKLTPAEIRELQQTVPDTSRAGPSLQETFRRIVVRRVVQRETAEPADTAAPAVRLWDPDQTVEVDAFTYWSKERFSGKPVISATHVRILRSIDSRLPDVIVAEDQVFATHYINKSTSLIALLRGDGDGPNYLAYLNRSQVDVLGGLLGGVVRMGVEHRLKAQAPTVLKDLRRKIESGIPEDEAADLQTPAVNYR